MVQNFVISIVIFIFSGVFAMVFGQTPEAVKPSVVTGDVVSINATSIVVAAKTGEVNVAITDKTEFKKVTAENPSLKTAVAATAADIGAGDKLMVTGIMNPDGKSLPARAVYLMSKSDIAQKRAKEIERWKTRGISGTVTAVNVQTNQITIETRGLMGSTKTVMTPKTDAKFMRYAADSVKWEEAKVSSLSEIAPGDTLRALGDKSADGTSFTAEEVVSGSFPTIAGTVKSVDVALKEVVITDLQTKKDLTVSFADVSLMKRFPAEFAERLTGGGMGPGGQRPAGQGGAGAPQGTANAGGTPTPGGQGQQGGMRPGGMGGPRGGIDEMIERFPTITAADLKVGEQIGVLSTKANGSGKIKAIKLLAGVEPFIRMAQMAAAASGGGRGQGSQIGLSIPGLDGIGTP